MEPKDHIHFALDVDNPDEAEALVTELSPYIDSVKIGLELITAIGVPAAIKLVHDNGGKIFADLKLNDIPKTVAGASRAITRHGVYMFNLHALSGPKAMTAAKEAVDEVMQSVTAPAKRPVVFAVTILTSLDYASLVQMHLLPEAIKDPSDEEKGVLIGELVANLALLTEKSGLDGVIASPKEVKTIRGICSSKFKIITPGVRPAGADVEDQKRIATPFETIFDGADGVVVGSPIRKAKNRIDAAKRIADEIGEALIQRSKS
jgi:orotidine-5'-phosphate decarboxylase